MCLQVLSHLFLSVCVCATDVWSRSSFWVRTFTFLRADVGKTINHVAYWWLTFTDCNQTHFCCQFWLHSLYSWWLWCFFSAVSMVSSFKADDDTHNLVWVGEKNKTKSKQNKLQQLYALLNIEAVQSRTKVGQGKSFSTAALFKQKWNSPVAIL